MFTRPWAFLQSMTAQAQTNGEGGGGGLTPIYFLVIMFGVMYFFLIRPQQVKERKRKEMLSALSKGDQVVGSTGTSLGTVRLTEKFISQHPVPHQDYENLAAHLQSELSSVKDRLPALRPEIAIGTAGTVTTLAALDRNIYPYDPAKVHAVSLPLDNIQKIQTGLKAQSIDERLQLKPLERGREDLIIAGIAIVLETLRTFGCPSLLVSEYGLREGIILKALQVP